MDVQLEVDVCGMSKCGHVLLDRNGQVLIQDGNPKLE